MNDAIDFRVIATTAAIVAGFGATVLSFRLQRELAMAEEGQPTRIPWADSLVLGAVTISILFVLLPMYTLEPSEGVRLFVKSAMAGALGLLLGYSPAILAHYRLLPGMNKQAHPANPDPLEGAIVIATVVLSVAATSLSLYTGRSAL